MLTVIKIGGSVLTGVDAYPRAAAFLERRLNDHGGKLLAIVSAERGATDALEALAQDLSSDPDPAMLDLLWSTGEIRSVALLTLALQARGIRAKGVNVHQTGLIAPHPNGKPGPTELRPLRLRALVATCDVLVAPGFLARSDGDGVASLGRGGSDLTAVLLAAGLGAARCELVKDVAGYYATDPNEDRSARPIGALTFDRAIQMADAGCELVQRQALVAARERRLPLIVRALYGGGTKLDYSTPPA